MQKEGLEKKKLVFHVNDNHRTVEKKICSAYPRLKDCGGFTLHRSLLGGYNRQLVKIDSLWFDVKLIRKKVVSRNGIIYIRPLQVDLDKTSASNEEVSICNFNKEICL